MEVQAMRESKHDQTIFVRPY